jgi:CheY-like chemotaxis protein
MQQVFMNLAVNARDAMQDGGELMIVLEQIEVQNSKHAPLPDMDAGEWVQITVKDTGMGIAEDKIPYIYEPFFTTKAPGKGSGLGLAQVYGIVRQHEGHIVARSHPGEGATFIIYLPASPLQRTQLSADSASTLVKGHGETILVVEDNEATRKALINGLEMLGYRVLEASDGRVGLAVYDRFGSEIDLVLTDLVMPEMGGKALVYALKMRNPKVKTLILTGHPLGEYDERLNEIGSTGWISKPVSLERLAEFTNRALQDQIPV